MTASLVRLTGINSALALKAPVRCATTGPITLQGLQTIDGVTFLQSDVAFPNPGTNIRVLVKNQTDLTQNGIYVVNTGAWIRAADFDDNTDAVQGTRVQVVQGTQNQGTWILTTPDPVFITNSGLGISQIAFIPQTLLISAIGTISSVAGVSQLVGTPGNLNTVITTRSYTVDGDLGGGTFIWSAANHSADITGDPQRGIFVPSSSDLTGTTGAWIRQNVGDVISARWFGAKGDGITDDTVAIQACVDWCIYFGFASNMHKRVVYLPSGIYKTTAGIQLGYGVNPQFTSVTFQGDGPSFDQTQADQTGTVISYQPSTPFTGMAINVQGARQTRIKGMTIVGTYTYITTNNLGSSVNDNDWTESTWRDPGVGPGSFNQYSVFAGITTDAYSGSQQTNHYPTVTYPSFLGGGITQYNKATSTDVSIEDVNISNFVVGVAQQPSAAPGNGEFVRWVRGVSTGNLRGFCVGGTQSRIPACEYVDFEQSYIAIDSTFVGNQAGNMQGVYQGCHFNQSFQIINVEGGHSSSICLRDCYAEGVATLGQVSATGNSTGLTLDNCTFDFREIADERHGVPAFHSGGADCKLALVNGTKLSTRYGFIVAYGGTTATLRMDGLLNVLFSGVADGLPAAYFDGCAGILSSGAFVTCPSMAYTGPGGIGQYYTVSIDTCNGSYIPWFARSYMFGGNNGTAAGLQRKFIVPPTSIDTYLGQTTTLANRSGKSVDDTDASARVAYQPGNGVLPLDVGDLIKIADAWFVVTSVAATNTGSPVHLKQISNYRLTAVGSTFVNKSSSDAAGARINQVIFSRVNANSTPLTGANMLLAGQMTNGSATLTNVKSALRDGNQWDADGFVGSDWAIIDIPEFINVGGSSVVRLWQVQSVNRGAQTITFVNSFVFNKSNFLIPFWIKQPTA